MLWNIFVGIRLHGRQAECIFRHCDSIMAGSVIANIQNCMICQISGQVYENVFIYLVSFHYTRIVHQHTLWHLHANAIDLFVVDISRAFKTSINSIWWLFSYPLYWHWFGQRLHLCVGYAMLYHDERTLCMQLECNLGKINFVWHVEIYSGIIQIVANIYLAACIVWRSQHT